jgi:hypothetical protein
MPLLFTVFLAHIALAAGLYLAEDNFGTRYIVSCMGDGDKKKKRLQQAIQ